MNANQLKLFMMSLMVLDHLAPLLPPQFVVPFSILTRCVGVFFGFMAVEGFHYTRNRKNYLLRLYGFAAIMFVGNTLINMTLLKDSIWQVHNNIFLTLAIGVSLLWALDFALRVKEPLFKLSAGLLAFLLFAVAIIGVVEGGFIIIPFMLISYFFREKTKKRDVAYLIFSAFLLLTTFIGLPEYSLKLVLTTLEMNPDFLFITVIPFLHLYNGKKGSHSPFFKYLFYIFYPAHLWFIALLVSFSTH
ncbi:TraX family protein [Enterococcus termitis]|jgi:hypothetical protein|uniref:Beta-carotene 15,15'-monooxygenase n=1 Tax=Enterococcus termitis TaxID=332950 RepID=A0A1E5H5V8_9ENTE|nr:TraX family protein [Enterococcus termitis]OEG20314.1 hypothetical protein BCR25_00355 [Enterococcus termitis]OJG97262.1 hypothetical protein RV18_GL000950 [Enterococcus termitis]